MKRSFSQSNTDEIINDNSVIVDMNNFNHSKKKLDGKDEIIKTFCRIRAIENDPCNYI